MVYKLVETADVFVQNFRQGVAERLGLGYDTLREINPKLIYGSASGYGPEGPDSHLPSIRRLRPGSQRPYDVRDARRR